LPGSLQGQVFYQPSTQGAEAQVQQQVARQREAQLTAMIEGLSVMLPEVLTFSPANAKLNRWLQRTLSQSGARLGHIRDRLFALAQLQRHHLVLDLRAGSGLLIWEALRQVPEGGVYAGVDSLAEATALQEQAAALPELNRPILVQSATATLPQAVRNQFPQVRFDRLIGRNVFVSLERHPEPVDLLALLQQWFELLHPDGKVILVETLPQQTQRLYDLIDASALSPKVYQRLSQAEEAIYTDPTDPLVNWDLDRLLTHCKALNLVVTSRIESICTELQITSAMLERWFSDGQARPSYRDRIAEQLSKSEIKAVQTAFAKLLNQTVQWHGAVGFLEIDGYIQDH
jgi:putative ATPase